MRNYSEPVPEAAKGNQDCPWRGAGFPLHRLSDIDDGHVTTRTSLRQNLDGNVEELLLKRARLAAGTAIHDSDDAVPISELGKRRRTDCLFGCQEIYLDSRFYDYTEAFGEAPRAEGQGQRPFGMALRELGSGAQVDEDRVGVRPSLIGRP